MKAAWIGIGLVLVYVVGQWLLIWRTRNQVLPRSTIEALPDKVDRDTGQGNQDVD